MNLKREQSILIVDDDADDRESIRDAFVENQVSKEYIFLHNGEQLISYLTDSTDLTALSLILLDLNMPGLDGRDALKKIRECEKLRHIPIIIFTTSSSQRDKEAAYSLGANCFITKPDTFKKLVEIAGSITKLWFAN